MTKRCVFWSKRMRASQKKVLSMNCPVKNSNGCMLERRLPDLSYTAYWPFVRAITFTGPAATMGSGGVEPPTGPGKARTTLLLAAVSAAVRVEALCSAKPEISSAGWAEADQTNERVGTVSERGLADCSEFETNGAVFRLASRARSAASSSS